jgi:uncharacterized protein DUF6058
MHPLNDYLARYFFTSAQLAAASALSCAELDDLLSRSLIPAPSYVVKGATVRSAVFGEMSAPGAVDGQYFHRACVSWVRRAAEVRSQLGGEMAYDELRSRFRDNLREACADLDRTVWRLQDCFRYDRSLIDAGFAARFESIWMHFQNGTYGICVAHADSELAIARKEVLQEKLIALTANGARILYAGEELAVVEQTIAEYAEACSLFSPVDYARSSRKRLVDDLRQSLEGMSGLGDGLADFPLMEGCETR